MKTSKHRLKVVILDDESNVEKAIQAKLPSNIFKTVTTINPDKIATLVKELSRRVVAARKEAKFKSTKTELDDADLFIVDYDLIKTKNEDYLTGERVAYLARCYSSCGVIVALNQFWRQPTFDLTLQPTLDSFAELNIAADDLTNRGLWKEGSWSDYRPWAWPVVTNLITQMQKRILDVARAKINSRVVDFLEFPSSVIERLPTASLELLGRAHSQTTRVRQPAFFKATSARSSRRIFAANFSRQNVAFVLGKVA